MSDEWLINGKKVTEEEMGLALLRETNYRCGYCLKNITPIAYYTDNRNLKEAKEIVPSYYNQYQKAHIVPKSDKTRPNDNSFENLLALCPNCHWATEQNHTNAAITLGGLKKQKLYWMIASGRLTRLEIDILMSLNLPFTTSDHNLKNGVAFNDLRKIDILNNEFDDIFNNISLYQNRAAVFLNLKIPKNLSFLVNNLKKLNMIESFCKTKPNYDLKPEDQWWIDNQNYQPQYYYKKDHSTYIVIIKPSQSTIGLGSEIIKQTFSHDDDNIYYWINDCGRKFCEQFSETYKEFD
jgi:hypothetical protein